MSLTQIIKGHVYELFNNEEELSKARLDICSKCPLLKKGKYGLVCNPNLFLDPETDETSAVSKEGYIRGCGCRLQAKSRLAEATCPANKWKMLKIEE